MGSPQDTNRTGEDRDKHYNLATLDRPCQHCKVLELDDAEYGGTIKHTKDGKKFVDFGVIQETRALGMKRWHCAERARAIGPGRSSAYQRQACPIIDLDYRRSDTLPDLPGFALTGTQGCAFCEILRGDIISTWDHLRDRENDKLKDEEEIYEAELNFTDMRYQFLEVTEDHDEDEMRGHTKRIYLDSLYVFFAIDWGYQDRHYSLHYTFYADDADPCASWFQIWRRPLSHEPLSPPSIKRLNTLIAKSLLATPAPIESSYFPTRLLDVGSSTISTELRLIVTVEHPMLNGELDPAKKRYAALSYCWGTGDKAKKQLRTTRHTIQKHTSEIEFKKLPQTVADAVQVCRHIGIRYLWVDALCIIQDSQEDWAEESFEMSKIYANSFITLCILQGSYCSSGFLENPHSPQTLQINFRSILDSSVSGRLYLRMLHPPKFNFDYYRKESPKAIGGNRDKPGDADIRVAPWSRRGRTFQESCLSPRKLLFGTRMFHISCGNLHESADEDDFDDTALLSQGEMGLSDVMNKWYDLVRNYGLRHLTYERDRFPGLSALARTISDQFPDQQYLAGLWKSDLHRGFLWIPHAVGGSLLNHMRSHEDGYIAPTWSWARHPFDLKWLKGTFSSEFEVRDTNIVTDDLNPYGRLLSGHLTLHAEVCELPLREEKGKVIAKSNGDVNWFRADFQYRLLSERNERIAALHIDWRTFRAEVHEEDPIDQLWMILTSSGKPPEDDLRHRDPVELMLGVLVLPTENEDEFVKVGLWYSEALGPGGGKLWDDIPRWSVTLA